MNDSNEKKAPSLVVILFKALILVLVVLVIFFIAYPHACVNLVEGRQTEINSSQEINKPLIQESKDVAPSAQPNVTVIQQEAQPAATVTPTAQPPAQTAQTTVQDSSTALDALDYEIVKRYVEIEKTYLQSHPNDSTSAAAITQQVMNENQLTADDWKEIVLKANDRGWFTQLRNQN